MASRILYPPVIADYIPAFIPGEGDLGCRIPFTLSRFNVNEDFESIHVSIVKQDNNLSVINDVDDGTRYRRNGKIILNVPTKIREGETDPSKREFQILNNDIKNGWITGTTYKVQIRLSERNCPSSSQNSQAAQLNDKASSFSEQSTVCIIKPTSSISIDMAKPFDQNEGEIRTLSEATIELCGRIVTEDKSEKLYRYNTQLYRITNGHENLIEDSGWLFSNKYQDSDKFYYLFKKEFKDSERYMIKFFYETINGYIGSQERTFDISYTLATAPEMRIITAEKASGIEEHYHDTPAKNSPSYKGDADGGTSSSENIGSTSENEVVGSGLTSVMQEEEEGRIGIKLYPTSSTSVFSGNFCIRRTDERSNFEDQIDLKILVLTNQELADLDVYYDYLIESGVYYKYAIQEIDRNGRRSLMREISDPIMRDFYYSFLLGENNQQLKLKFDNAMQSFKIQQIESKIEPIGSKYAKATRNAAIEYRTFPIAGLISFQMDDNKIFTDRLKVYGSNAEIHEHTGTYDYIQERDFRMKVLEFLQDGKPKLFKSPTEGNIVVRLMDVNCTPNQSLDRMLYSFNSNAFELAEATMNNYLKYNFYQVGEYQTSFAVDGTALGQLSMDFSFDEDIIQKICDKYTITTENIGGYIRTVKRIYQVRITINDLPMRLKIEDNDVLGHIITTSASGGNEIIIKNNIYDFDNEIDFVSGVGTIRFVDNGKVLENYNPNNKVNANIDFVYDYSLEQYLGKKKINYGSEKGVGQIFGNYQYNESIYQDIFNKYYVDTATDFRYIEQLPSIVIEADPGCIFYIQDGIDRNAQPHEINITGILALQNLSNIREIKYGGKRINSNTIDTTSIATVSVTYYYILLKGNYEVNSTI